MSDADESSSLRDSSGSSSPPSPPSFARLDPDLSHLPPSLPLTEQSLADFLRSTGPDPAPVTAPPAHPIAQPAPFASSSALSSPKKSGGGLFNLGRKKTSTKVSSDAGDQRTISASLSGRGGGGGGASMAVGSSGIGNVRGVETVVTASGQTVNIIPYKPPHLPPLAGSVSLESINPTLSGQQNLYRTTSSGKGHPYPSQSSSSSQTATIPRSGSQGALNVLSQAREDARAAESRGMKRFETAPNVADPSSSYSSRHAPPRTSSPPLGQPARRPATSNSPPISSPRAFGATTPTSSSPLASSLRNPRSTAPDEYIQSPSRKLTSSAPPDPPSAVLNASIHPQQQTSYTPHHSQRYGGRADSPTDPTLPFPSASSTTRTASHHSDEGEGVIVGLGFESREQRRVQEQISTIESLGQKIETDEEGNVVVGRRVERRHVAVQVGAIFSSGRGEDATRKVHHSGASSVSVAKDSSSQTLAPALSLPSLSAEDRRMGSSPEFFSTPTASSDGGTFVSVHSSHSGESLLGSGGNTVLTSPPTTASSSTTSTLLSAATFSTSTTSSTSTSASTSPRQSSRPLAVSSSQKSTFSPPSLSRTSGHGGTPVLSTKKTSSTRPQILPELGTSRGVFSDTSNQSSPSVVASTQEEKDRERRLAYLEEKVKREVERRKEAEGQMKRLNQATSEQKGRWEDMAGWALDVMERTERERTVLRQENATLKRELELWKMKAQVAESSQHMEKHSLRAAAGGGWVSPGGGVVEE